jgi:hypothetical protein
MKKSQSNKLLRHFRKGGKITIYGAFSVFGITSLHRRLSDLRDRGIIIEDDWIDLPSGKRVKEYWIEKTKP